MIKNFGSKSFAFLRVGHGTFKSTRCYTQCLSGDTDTSGFEHHHGKFKAETIFANTVFFGYFNILKHYRMGVGAAHAHFVFVGTEGDAGRVFVNNKSIDTTMTFFRMGLCNNNIGGSRVGVGNPVFGTVYQVVITFVFCRGMLMGGIGSGFGF